MTCYKAAMIGVVSVVTVLGSEALASDDTFVQIQEMVYDLGGQHMIKKNNGKVLKCANGGSKKITIRGGSYSAVYRNCREYGSTRDGEKFISIGGGDDEAPVERTKFSSNPFVESEWNVARNRNSPLAVMTSGTVELSFNDKNSMLKEVKGLPDLKKFNSQSYKFLNATFGTKFTSSSEIDSIDFLNYILKVHSFDRLDWGFCEPDKLQTEKGVKNCNMTPFADAASLVVDRFNEGSLQPLVDSYVFTKKFAQKAPFKKGAELIEIVRWCSYGACNFASDVYTDINYEPSAATISQAFDFFNYLTWASNNAKILRDELKDGDETVKSADSPEMYKEALSFLYENFNDSKKLVTQASANTDILKLYDVNPSAAKVKLVAKKLQQEYKVPERKALDIAVHSIKALSVSSRWDSNKYKVPRIIRYGYENSYKGVIVGDKVLVEPFEINKWVQELVQKKSLLADIAEQERVLAKDSQNFDALMAIAYLHMMNEEPQKSVEIYEKAVTLATKAEDKARALNGLGWVNRQINQNEKALANLEQVLAIDSRHLNALFNMGALYALNLKQPEKAAEYFRRYLEVDSDSETAEDIKAQLTEWGL